MPNLNIPFGNNEREVSYNVCIHKTFFIILFYIQNCFYIDFYLLFEDMLKILIVFGVIVEVIMDLRFLYFMNEIVQNVCKFFCYEYWICR